MSALAEHPNTIEARQFRRQAIEHAMRCLYRDHTWVDPDGNLSVGAWLTRIPYMDKPRQREMLRGWVRAARIDSLTPVGALEAHERERLVWQMLRFLKASAS